MRLKVSLLITVCCLLAVMVVGCGGGSNGINKDVDDGDVYNVSEYLPLTIGNSWVYSYDGDIFTRKVTGTKDIDGHTVMVIKEYYGYSTTDPTEEEYYWTSDANGWTIYGKQHYDGQVSYENPPLVIPNGLHEGESGTSGNCTYTLSSVGSYNPSILDAFRISFRYGQESEYMYLGKGIGVVSDNGDYIIRSWNIY